MSFFFSQAFKSRQVSEKKKLSRHGISTVGVSSCGRLVGRAARAYARQRVWHLETDRHVTVLS